MLKWWTRFLDFILLGFAIAENQLTFAPNSGFNFDPKTLLFLFFLIDRWMNKRIYRIRIWEYRWMDQKVISTDWDCEYRTLQINQWIRIWEIWVHATSNDVLATNYELGISAFNYDIQFTHERKFVPVYMLYVMVNVPWFLTELYW